MNKLRNAILTGLVTVAPVAAAQAQDATQPAPAPAAVTSGGLEEVVVTAQRRNERSVDVPISISAISATALTAQGITSSRDLGDVVPGLRIDQDGSYTQPTLRGIGNAVAGPGVNPAVATYIDGFYQPSQLNNDFDLVGLTGIQVLKGPQGTLFGRNATGGAIQVTTKNPTFDPTFSATAGYGSYEEKRFTAYASGGITDDLAANIAALYRHGDGFVTNTYTNSDTAARVDKWYVRAKLLYQPSDDFSALLGFETFKDLDNNSVAYNSYEGLNAVAGTLGALGIPQPAGFQAPSGRGDVAQDGINTFYGYGGNINLTLKANIGDWAKLTSLSQDREERFVEAIDYDATPANVYDATFNQDERTFTQEFDLSSSTPGPFQWATGLYYYWDQSDNKPYYQHGYFVNLANPNTVTDFYDTSVHSRSYAAFGDATYETLKDFFITVGARYSIEDQRGYGVFDPEGIPAGVAVGSPVNQGGGPLPPNPGVVNTQSFYSFTPRAVFRYNFMPNANVFFSYSNGFKSGGFSPSSVDSLVGPNAFVQHFAPEKVTAYELGAKASLGRYRLEGSIYRDDYDDQQVAFYTAGTGHIQNAAASEIYGAELALTAKVTDQFSLNVNGSYNHGRYASFPAAAVSLLNGAVSRDISGEVMQRAPELTGNIDATYKQPIMDGTLTATANLYMTTKFNLDPSGTYYQNAYALLNARVTYAFADDRYHVAAFGNNITDTRYLASVLPFSGIAILQQYAAPAEWGVELGVDF